MCSPLWSVYSRRVSTHPGSRSMMLRLLVSRRFRLFILCLIAPLVINLLTPELITASIISWVLQPFIAPFSAYPATFSDFPSLLPLLFLAHLGSTLSPNCHRGFQSILLASIG